jgi:hypothetical protein
VINQDVKLILILLFTVFAAGCGDATPKVDFLNSNILKKDIPGVPGSSNLTPTQELTNGTVNIKSRVSYVGTQTTLSGGGVTIQGKISY